MKTLNASTLVLTFAALIFSINTFASDIIRDSKQKKGLYYQIKLENQNINDDMYNRFETVDQFITPKSDYNFRLGVFNNYKTAKNTAQTLEKEGFENLKIVAYFNKANISIEDAMVFSNNQMKFEDNLSIDGNNISVEELNKLLFQNAGDMNLQYKVHLGMYAEKAEIPTFNTEVKVTTIETEQGFYTYTLGNFSTKEEAIKFRKQLVASGVNEAFVVPYFEEKRVSITLAQKLEDYSKANLANLNK